jgi:antitoxin component of RelBE/YafQ-DinJ toxin-antitoxin module
MATDTVGRARIDGDVKERAAHALRLVRLGAHCDLFQ